MTQWGYIDLSYRTLGALPDPILGRKFVTACLESNYPNTIFSRQRDFEGHLPVKVALSRTRASYELRPNKLERRHLESTTRLLGYLKHDGSATMQTRSQNTFGKYYPPTGVLKRQFLPAFLRILLIYLEVLPAYWGIETFTRTAAWILTTQYIWKYYPPTGVLKLAGCQKFHETSRTIGSTNPPTGVLKPGHVTLLVELVRVIIWKVLPAYWGIET